MNKLQDFAELMKTALAEKKARDELSAIASVSEANAVAKKKEKRQKKIKDGAINFINQLEGKPPVEPEPVVEEAIQVEVPEIIVREPDVHAENPAIVEDLMANVIGLFEPLVEKTEPKIDVNIATIKRLQDDIANLRRYIDAKVSSVDTGWQGGGGGAARIADLDDVDVRTVPVAENDILMYDPIKRKWLPKTLTDLADDLGPLIGGKLYAPYNRMIDVVGNKTYIGEASPGVAVSQTGWRIKMIEELPTGDLQIIWADGSEIFDLIWDDRLTYTYDVT